MKSLLIVVLILLFISCEEETNYEYPDCISKPNKIVESFGCGNIFVYQNLDSSRVLTVSIDGENFRLTKKCQTIDLDDSTPNVSVVLEIAGNDPDSIYFNFCNDVAYINSGVTTKYKATSGKLTFSVSEDNPIKEPIWNSFYNVTIKIENLYLYNQAEDDEVIITEITYWDVGVGWFPG